MESEALVETPGDVNVVALTPAGMVPAQAALVTWCARKIQALEDEAAELELHQRLAVENGWKTSVVVANINRYAQRPLHIGDPAIGQLSFTGTVDVQSLNRWLVALQTVFPVRVHYGAGGDTIVPAAPSHLH